MGDTYKLNRMDFNILQCLYDGGYKDHYHSITITDLLKDNEDLLGARMTVYKKLIKLVKAGYIKKGCLDNHADTFYLLEKAIRIVEGGGKVVSPIRRSGNIAHDNDSVRSKLIEITYQGLLLKAIALNVRISENDLSKFKGGMNCLKDLDVINLSEYLNAVVIPQWGRVAPDTKMTARERLLASRNGMNDQNKEPEKKKSTRDLLFM